MTDWDTLTDEQLENAYDACEATAKKKFLKAGGDEEDFEQERHDGAVGKSADALEICVDSELSDIAKNFETATEAERDAFFKKCEKESVKAFEKAGGSRSDAAVAKKKGAAKKSGDAMKVCIETTLKKRGTCKQIRGDTDKCAAQNDKKAECLAVLSSAENGGGAACTFTATNRVPPTAKQLIAAKSTCQATIKTKFQKLGGKNADFEGVQLGREKQPYENPYKTQFVIFTKVSARTKPLK